MMFLLQPKYDNGILKQHLKVAALNAVADMGELQGGYEEGEQYGRAVTEKRKLSGIFICIRNEAP